MKKAELVFIPAPGMGHLMSTVEVVKPLVDLNPNLSITVIIIQPPYDSKITAYVDSLIANTSFISTRIKFIILPRPDNDDTAAKLLDTLVQNSRPLIKEAVTNIVQFSSSVPDSPRLTGFVVDMFLTSLVDLAEEFGVPSYAFYTSGAAFLGFHFYVQALYDEQNVDFVELKDSDTEFIIPSFVNPVSTNFFPTVMFNPELSTMLRSAARGLREVKGIIVNTFSELESHAVESLSDGRLPPVYPVGPILNLDSASGVHQNSDTTTKWLDEQPYSSVVFLCFGSMGSFGADQVREIACALEQSGHRFLWSLRQPPDPAKGRNIMTIPKDYDNVAEVLPDGFLDRTAGIGKIIGWAPQVAILGHPAIGGFVSHCGWNSTLESLWFGVPIATWPLYSEQHLNAFELVTELGLAVEIKMDHSKDSLGNDAVEIVRAEKIERGIRCLMEQDTDVRRRVKEMSEKSRKALMDGGSSHSTLCRFIDDVMHNIT
ncbi:anthocyanidin 3-O-glucosyltransferase 2-like [Durio zibethinus]|uniref:Glycosyltransferase n=1 Tax=Durio zibethinus TaxID=66656 RepID=A0A6P6B3P8_DURZI|nr:anthocyanidin 3-O-glucosyltransferase 2-like [Durio zibethinus]